MNLIQKIPQSLRILIVGVVVPAMVIGVLAWRYHRESQDNAVQETVSRARAVCLTAESVRANAEDHWSRQIFDRGELLAWGQSGDLNKVLSTVPIVMSMRSLQKNAEQAGYEFYVPAVNARNPKNRPDDLQKAALDQLVSGNLEEYIHVDRETNRVHYYRPVHIGKSCLMCHGDPATSQELWANSSGIDITGHPMENLSEGDFYGAFEIVQSLEQSSASANTALVRVGTTSIIGLTMCGLLSMVILRSVRNDVRSQAASIGQDVAIEVSNNTANIASAIEQLSSNIREISDGASSASELAREVVQRVEITNEKGALLNQNSEEIGNIVQLIQSIAEQTNLLALNATIEAARAGESGKGFAVVAGEVKELARETSKATSTITSRISAIQGASTQLLDELDNVRLVIRRIDDSQSAIAGAVHQQKSASDEIGRTIHHVLDSSRRLSDRLTGSGQ